MSARSHLTCVSRALAWLTLASMSGAATAGPDEPRNDALTCALPFDLQAIRDLDFGRVVVARGNAGQVDVDADGGYRQLGGAYVAVPATPAELQFCGPPGASFEIHLRSALEAGYEGSTHAARLAPGSLHLAARGAELRRLNTSLWEGVIGAGGRVSLRFGGRLDIPPGAASNRSSTRLSVSLRSR